MKAVLEAYALHLTEAVQSCPDYEICPGVVQVLDALKGRSGIAMGLGTGNVQVGARLKLARANLWDYFSFGGFASDAVERRDVLKVGKERGIALLGVEPDECRVVVIGDTPADVSAARAIDADVVAVGTGFSDLQRLEEANPDVLMPVIEPERLVRYLVGGHI